MNKLSTKAQNTIIKKEKPGLIGHFLSNKKMIFDDSVNVLAPEKDDGQPKKLIDYSVIKKGINTASMKPKEKKELEEKMYQDEEDRIGKEAKENARLQKLAEAERRMKEEEEIEKHKEAMKGGAKKEENVAGKLRMA